MEMAYLGKYYESIMHMVWLIRLGFLIYNSRAWRVRYRDVLLRRLPGHRAALA